MPAKTSNGKRPSHEKPLHQSYAHPDSPLRASGGALARADELLGITEPTALFFSLTGEKRTIHRGDLYLLGTPDLGGVYVASGDGDEYLIAEVKLAPKE